MSTQEASVRIGQSRESLAEFVEAMHVAEDAVQQLGTLCRDPLDRQVFETIQELITHAASAIWDGHPQAGQFIEDFVRAGRGEEESS